MKQRHKSVAEDLRRVDLPPCKYYFSTGSVQLDLAVSDRYPGGIGSGRITQIYGDESTAKTLLVQEILGAVQRAGGTPIFEDKEHTLDFARAERLFGLHTGVWPREETQAEYEDKPLKEAAEVCTNPNFIYRIPTYIEALYDDEIGGALELIKKGVLISPVAIGVDSLSAVPSKAELGADLEKSSMGTSRAKMFSQAFRKYIDPMAKHHLTVIGIDQTRTNIGVKFGDPDTTSGGKAIKFYASTRIKLQHVGMIKTKAGGVVGVKIRFNVIKNKLAPPHRSGILRILFDYGVDDLSANLDWLHEIVNPSKEKKQKQEAMPELKSCFSVSGTWWQFGDLPKAQGLDALVQVIEKHEAWKAVEEEVVRLWRIVHKPPDRVRKPR